MRWEYIDHFEIPTSSPEWMATHCQSPTPYVLNENSVRVYFSCRDSSQIARISFVDMRFGSDGTIEWSPGPNYPSLSVGGIGCFDQHGVYPSSIINYGGCIYLYYAGYSKGHVSPLFYASIGLAKSQDGQVFERCSLSPLLSRSQYDPCLVTSPNVQKVEGAWHMHYVSGFKWELKDDGRLQSYYDIKYAAGKDPFDWKRDGKVSIGLLENETNLSRPTVLRLPDNKFHMWFCYVDKVYMKYKIGYATSQNYIDWVRDDSKSGFPKEDDSSNEMQAYPYIFELNGSFYMLYNGDNYGSNGFKISKLIFGIQIA